MKLFDSLLKLRKEPTGAKGSGRIAVVHWDRENIHFLVVSPKTSVIHGCDIGVVPYAEVGNPFNALANHFREQRLHVQRLVVLLSRPELDLLTLSLPPSEESELPALIAIEVEQQLGETEAPAVLDYDIVRSTKTDDTAGTQVLAFTMSAKEWSTLQSQVQAAGFRLAAACSRQLSPLGILRRSDVDSNGLIIAVHLYAGEAELAVCRGTDPILLRSIRIISDDPARIAEQILTETERCLTLLPQETADLPHQWMVFATSDVAAQVVEAIRSEGKIEVRPIEPLVGWTLEGTPSSPAPSTQRASAANAGAAWDFLHDALPVNLLAPKRAPKPPNKILRWSALGAAATLVCGVGVTFLLSDIRTLQGEVSVLETNLDHENKIVAKYQEKADQVRVIDSWLTDQVDWLTELSELSNRLPDGQSATVRRLTASTNAETATFDLSVQVADQEYISQLENRIRSAKYSATSKQISQNPDASDYPWQFETRVTFSIESPTSKRYAPRSQKPNENETPKALPDSESQNNGSKLDEAKQPATKPIKDNSKKDEVASVGSRINKWLGSLAQAWIFTDLSPKRLDSNSVVATEGTSP